MLLTFVCSSATALFAAGIRNHVISRPRVLVWMRRAFAGAFAGSEPSSPSPIADAGADGEIHTDLRGSFTIAFS